MHCNARLRVSVCVYLRARVCPPLRCVGLGEGAIERHSAYLREIASCARRLTQRGAAQRAARRRHRTTATAARSAGTHGAERRRPGEGRVGEGRGEGVRGRPAGPRAPPSASEISPRPFLVRNQPPGMHDQRWTCGRHDSR